jgi:hypothetical protein
LKDDGAIPGAQTGSRLPDYALEQRAGSDFRKDGKDIRLDFPQYVDSLPLVLCRASGDGVYFGEVIRLPIPPEAYSGQIETDLLTRI